MNDEEIAYRPGQVLASKYRVDKVIGVGGFGAVLQATHLQLEEPVAIKTLLPHAAKNPAAAERFLREAKAAVRIRSEHVARVSDVGKLDDGTPYMVMEYLAGMDLSQLVKAQGVQQFHDVAEWVIQAGEAIAEAHSLGIVHRDLKPANLFLTRKVDGAPCVKVLDFGISKLTNELGDKGMTKTSDVMGSPFYMSPEQMRSTRSVDARCDIWALGAILYELLAGCTPFDAETMTALVVNIMQEPPREITSFRRDLPPALREIVLKCLEKDPNARFSDVASLANALAPFAPPRAQAVLQRIWAISGKGPTSGASAPSGASAIAATVAAAPVQHTMGGGAPAPMLLSEQARMTPGGVHPVHPTVLQNAGLQQLASQSGGVAQAGTSAGHVSQAPAVAIPSPPAQSWGATYAGKKTSSSLPLLVGLGALAVAVLGGGGFLLLRGKESSAKPNPTSAAPSTQAEASVPRVDPTPTASPATITSSAVLASDAPPTKLSPPQPPGSGAAPGTTSPPKPSQTAAPPAPPSAVVQPQPTAPPPPQPTTPPKPPKKPGGDPLFQGTD
jgi:serine/threonine protein kinase